MSNIGQRRLIEECPSKTKGGSDGAQVGVEFPVGHGLTEEVPLPPLGLEVLFVEVLAQHGAHPVAALEVLEGVLQGARQAADPPVMPLGRISGLP